MHLGVAPVTRCPPVKPEHIIVVGPGGRIEEVVHIAHRDAVRNPKEVVAHKPKVAITNQRFKWDSVAATSSKIN